MMILPYKPEHLEELLLQPSQAYMRPFMSDKVYQNALQIEGMAFSAIMDGKVIACAGVLPLWENRGHAWALLNDNIKTNFVSIHRATARFLDTCRMNRIETHVDKDFGCALRWMEMLGFECEGTMRKYTSDGRDAYMFARVR